MNRILITQIVVTTIDANVTHAITRTCHGHFMVIQENKMVISEWKSKMQYK